MSENDPKSDPEEEAAVPTESGEVAEAPVSNSDETAAVEAAQQAEQPQTPEDHIADLEAALEEAHRERLLALAAAVSADAAPLDQTVGQTLRINLNALVKPNPDTGQRPRELSFSRPRPRTAEDVPQVPDGFSIALYAEDLEHARNMEDL